MIKVLEEKKEPRATVRCNGCRSLLEYGNSDLSKKWESNGFSSPPNHLWSSFYIICPQCGLHVDASWIKPCDDGDSNEPGKSKNQDSD